MDERRAKLKIGLFVLLGVVLFSGFVIVLGNVSLYGGTPLVLYAHDSVGLKVRAPVRVLGIPVGLVREVGLVARDIPLRDDVPYPIRVDLTIRDEHVALLRQGARFAIEPSTILGEKIVAIDPGRPDAPPLDLSQPVWAEPPGGLDAAMGKASKLADRLDATLAKTDVFEKASDLLTKVGDAVERLTGRAETTLSEVDATLQEARQALVAADVPALRARVDVTLTKLDTALDGVNRQVPALSGDARALLSDARAATADLRDLAGRLGGKADGALGHLERVLASLDQGDGLAAQLLRDREIYYDLKELVRDLKQHPWKVLWKD
jgi:phospholipid/cholesterol/gamma-HCH transport system substrate-binding protein